MGGRPYPSTWSALVSSRRAVTLGLVAWLGLAGCGFFGGDPLAEDLPSGAPADGVEPGPADGRTTTFAPDVGQPVEIVRVIDGDSLEVVASGGDVVELRLAGYNAPELYGPGGRAAGATCNGAGAKAGLEALVADAPAGGEIRLVPEAGDADRFGRTLGDLSVNGTSTVRSLIEAGWGLATGDDAEQRALMRDAADRAVGLWGDGCGSAASSTVVVAEVQADPPGSDRDNLNEEWVELANVGDGPVDLSGWVLRDDTTGHRFELDAVVDAGDRLRIRTGSGGTAEDDADDDGDVYLGERFPVWSNQGDTVLLVDPAGVVAAWAFIE